MVPSSIAINVLTPAITKLFQTVVASPSLNSTGVAVELDLPRIPLRRVGEDLRRAS